ncbi:MAG: hypothetical protein LJE67_12440 [Salaquimonas sp.]|nr:hypothetical protein [Salaquimonas sp.]
MLFSLKDYFGRTRAPEDKEARQAEIVEGARIYDIIDSYRNLSKQLGDHISLDMKEAEPLRKRRVDAFAAQHQSGYRPHDVFNELPIVPVDPDHMLKQVKLKKSAPKTLPEFSYANRIQVVSKRVRDALRELEPNRHRFFPLTVTRHDNSESYPYYFIQYLEKIDCVCLPLSGFEQAKNQDGVAYWRAPDRKVKQYYWADCVGDRHMFWDRHGKARVVVSQKLVDTLGDFLPRGIELSEGGIVRRKSN